MNVYFVVSVGNPLRMKIGKAKDVARRVAELQIGNAERLQLLAELRCKSEMHAKHMEGEAHRYFAFARKRGEWFMYDKKIGNKVRNWVARNSVALRIAA